MLISIPGAPGSGKGTLCQIFAKDHGFYHLSVGDLLRHVCRNKESAPENVAQYVEGHTLVPIGLLGPIIMQDIEDAKRSGHRKFLIDGFPRRLDQAAYLEEKVGGISHVLFFHCPESVAKKRFLSRQVKGREGDNEEVFNQRYAEFKKENQRIIEHYFLRPGNMLWEVL